VAEDPTNGRELWKSDGTDAGTVLVKDIRPGSRARRCRAHGRERVLFFSANDGANVSTVDQRRHRRGNRDGEGHRRGR
jgi:ELWxxDGT repeat protein